MGKYIKLWTVRSLLTCWFILLLVAIAYLPTIVAALKDLGDKHHGLIPLLVSAPFFLSAFVPWAISKLAPKSL